MTEPLRVGLVGAGVMGFNHARVLSLTEGVALAGVADPDPARLSQVRESFGCPTFESVDALIGAGLDAAVIASPNTTHGEVGLALLRAGVHVLIEKPIAPTVEEAERLIVAAREAKRVLMVGHIERFNPAVQALSQACRNSEIVSISITRVGPFPPRMSKVGVIIDLGVHDIDLVRLIAGADIESWSARHTRAHGEREDTALLLFRTTNGIVAQVNTNWVTPFKQRTIEVATRDKFVTADLITRQVTEFSDYQPDGSYRTRKLWVSPTEPLRLEIDAFVDAVVNNAPPAITGEDGLSTLRIALGCLEDGEAAAPHPTAPAQT